MSAVTLIEVTPRDGFQAIKAIIPTELKIKAIRLLGEAGFSRMEIGAFVGPRHLPQMADIGEVIAATTEQARYVTSVLVPNAKGARLAQDAGVTKLVYVLSVSNSHNQNNVGRSTEQSLVELAQVTRELESVPDAFLRLNLATCFDCPFEGEIPALAIARLVERIVPLRAQIEFGICDTTGRGNPHRVRSLLGQLRPLLEGRQQTLAFHGHDTFGMGVVNTLAAVEAGVSVVDAATAGLGGCPFAPGASGNTATEDLVFMFERMGIRTGVDLGALLDAGEVLRSFDPASSGSRLSKVDRQRVVTKTT